MAAGRLKFSRHAFPDGWSLLGRFDIRHGDAAIACTDALSGGRGTPRLAGNRAAQALKELLRIRSVPAELMAQADLASGDAAVGGVRLRHADRPHQAPAGIAEALRVGN
jgi:hypothetical protein